MPTADGYPTDAELAEIEAYVGDPAGWLALIKRVWWAADWGWTEARGTVNVSTGGWSGNEEVIGAMRVNPLWGRTYESMRRGGHYTFIVAKGEGSP